MYRFLSFLLIFQFIFAPVFVYAEETTDTPLITNIKKGDLAPYDGSLLNKEALAKIQTEYDKQKKLCELETEYLTTRQKIDCDLKISAAKIELEALKKKYDSVVQIKQDEIERLQDLAIKNDGSNNKWWLAGGVAAGVLITVGMFLLVVQVQKVQ